MPGLFIYLFILVSSLSEVPGILSFQVLVYGSCLILPKRLGSDLPALNFDSY